MNRFSVRCLLALGACVTGVCVHARNAAAQAPAAHVEEASRKEATPAAPAARPIAPLGHNALFGSLPIATRSDETRKLIEKAIDQYENVLLDQSVDTAHRAALKDSHSALAYAIWSYAANRSQPLPDAMQRAKALAPKATPDEKLFVNWLLDVQQGDNIAAIGAMNDLLARFPEDKHILYFTSEWLYLQEDYDRSRTMMEKILRIDPNFPPALNMLGYTYMLGSDPDPAKAISYLKRYAASAPNQPNPEDSLGEILRFAGDDKGSLEHYAAALKIITNFITSQFGLGDTSTLMGDYGRARSEYDKALTMATNNRDRLHAEYQKALVYFWEGHPEQGRKALDYLTEEARRRKEPYAQFEIGFGRAMLSGDASSELDQLRALEGAFQKPLSGMSEPDRHVSLASVVREEARVAGQTGKTDTAQDAVGKLERLAAQTRNLIVANSCESARGYLLFAQGDFPAAADELATDPHSPLALQQLAITQEKLDNAAAADATRTRLKYQRAPTVEWYLVAHLAKNDAQASNETH
jgi:tetratricopeptide (TPR) repeat protein